MMRSDTLNWHEYGSYTEMTALSLNIYSTDEYKSKHIIVHKTLSHICSTNKGESKRRIVNETLSQKYFTNVEKICSTNIDIPEYTITEQKFAEYEDIQLQRKC